MEVTVSLQFLYKGNFYGDNSFTLMELLRLILIRSKIIQFVNK